MTGYSDRDTKHCPGVSGNIKDMSRAYIELKLLSIGLPPAYKGFRYIVDAIFILSDTTWNCDKVMVLYDKIAKINGSTCKKVEKDIRYILDLSRRNGNSETKQYLGCEYPQTKNTLYRLCSMIEQDYSKGGEE